MLDTAHTPVLVTEGSMVADRYRVVRCLKLGAMGGIYQVLDEQTDRFRALKVMLPDAALDDDLRLRFEQEAVVAGRIRSDHVVAVTDSGITEGTRFIVMELLDGRDLGIVVSEGGALTPEEALPLLQQVARGLDKIHREAIVHRDLKPANIFLCKRDDGAPLVKILDFGIAKNIASLATLKTTRALGTPLYMAPEQLTGDATIDARADLYALGLVAYTLLAGEPYWLVEAKKAPSAFSFCNRVIAGIVEPASARAARGGVLLGSSFDSWFERAIAKSPKDRFDDASQQIDALAEALDSAASDADPASRRAITHVWWAIGAGLTVAMAIGVAQMFEAPPQLQTEHAVTSSLPQVATTEPFEAPPALSSPAPQPTSHPRPVASKQPKPLVVSPPVQVSAAPEVSASAPRRDPLDDL